PRLLQMAGEAATSERPRSDAAREDARCVARVDLDPLRLTPVHAAGTAPDFFRNGDTASANNARRRLTPVPRLSLVRRNRSRFRLPDPITWELRLNGNGPL